MLAKRAVIFVVALLVSACGYHLRGAIALPVAMKNIYLEGGSGQLRDQFKQMVTASGGQLANSRQGAGLVVRILNEENNRRTLSLSSRGKSNEFELYYRVEYELANEGNAVLMERQPIEIRREYYNDQEAVLAKENEEKGIRDEMYQQAARTIVNRARVVLEAGAK